jgi:putative salt-induced outer membrane protein YdiY
MHVQPFRHLARGVLAAVAAASILLASASRADDPKFAWGKKDEIVKMPDWAASVTAGFGMSTGNAQALNFSGAGMVSHRFTPNDLLAFDAMVAFQRSTIQSARDNNNDGVISPDEVFNISQSVSEAWGTKLRYDHFFDLNAIYGFVFAGGDIPAGKQFVGGVQAGYSRALYKTATSELVGELGLDYTYQRYVVGTPNAINIAAVRAYLGYLGNPNGDLSYNASLEYLGNLNAEETPTGRVGSFGDNRAVGKLGVTWKIFGDGSLGFRFRALYDSAPAPKPPPSGFSWAPGYLPLANPWDTFTELVLVYKLL